MCHPSADLEGAEVAGEDAGGGPDHHQERGQGDGEEDQREEELSVAGAEAHGGEEGSVDDEGPGAEGKDEGEEPGVPEDVEVEEDDEDGGEDGFDDAEGEQVCNELGETRG